MYGDSLIVGEEKGNELNYEGSKGILVTNRQKVSKGNAMIIFGHKFVCTFVWFAHTLPPLFMAIFLI